MRFGPDAEEKGLSNKQLEKSRFCHQLGRITSIFKTRNGEFLKFRGASF